MKRDPHEFHARLLLDPRHLYRAARSLTSWSDFAGRAADLRELLAKILAGRYGDRYWAAQRAVEQALGERQPRRVTVTFVHDCRRDCRMCANEGVWSLSRRTAAELTDWMPLLDRLTWRGGEVFERAEFRELFDAARRHPRLQQDIATSGLTLTDEWIRALASARARLRLTVDGVTPETYALYRPGRDLAALRGRLAALAAGGGRGGHTLEFTVMKSNVRELDQVLDFAAEHGLGDVHFLPLVSAPERREFCARESLAGNVEAEGFLKDAVPRIRRRSVESGVGFRFHFPVGGERPASTKPAPESEAAPPGELELIGGSLARSDLSGGAWIGDARSQTLDDIWNGTAMRLARRSPHDDRG